MSALGHLAGGGPAVAPTPLRRRKALPYLLLLPGLLWLAFFFVIVTLMVPFFFAVAGFTSQHATRSPTG